jgi:hypothetical protein
MVRCPFDYFRAPPTQATDWLAPFHTPVWQDRLAKPQTAIGKSQW